MSAGSVRLKQKMTDLISGLSQDAEEKRQKNNELQEYIMEIEVKELPQICNVTTDMCLCDGARQYANSSTLLWH